MAENSQVYFFEYLRLLSKKMEFPKLYGFFDYFPGLIIIVIGIKSMLSLRIIYKSYLEILINGFGDKMIDCAIQMRDKL
jgi:hypothetical protein